MAKLKRLTQEETRIFAEKLMELGNLVFIGLVIAQVVPASGQFRLSFAGIGTIFVLTAYFIAYAIMKKN